MTEMCQVWINDRWPLLVAKHRAERPVWHHWEAGRLASMYHYLGLGKECLCEDNAHVPNGEVVYDIGAEEGDFPGLYSSWGCDVVLFEPNDRVWPNIKAIWEANQLRPPLACWPGFAGPEGTYMAPALAKVMTSEWPGCAYGEVIGDHGFCNLCERPDIPVVSIDAVASVVKPPTAITIDVEGAEYEVLLGAQNVLREHKPKVWVSVHPEEAYVIYDRPFILEDIQALMADCGYPQDPATGEFGTFIASDHEDHWVWLP